MVTTETILILAGLGCLALASYAAGYLVGRYGWPDFDQGDSW